MALLKIVLLVCADVSCVGFIWHGAVLISTCVGASMGFASQSNCPSWLFVEARLMGHDTEYAADYDKADDAGDDYDADGDHGLHMLPVFHV